MPFVRLHEFSGQISFLREDGDVGYVVGLHWTRWFLFWLWTALLLGAVLVGGALAYKHGWFGDVGSGSARALYLGGCVVAALVAFGWYYDMRQTFIIATPLNVYESRVQKLVWNVDRQFPVIDASRFESDIEGIGILGVRRLAFHSEGDAPDIVLKHSSATQRDLDALHRLIHSTNDGQSD